MPGLECHFPITVSVTGQLDDDALACLAAEVEKAVRERILFAERELDRRLGSHPALVLAPPGPARAPSRPAVAGSAERASVVLRLASYEAEGDDPGAATGHTTETAAAALTPLTTEEIIDLIGELFPESAAPTAGAFYGVYTLLAGTDRPLLYYLRPGDQGRVELDSIFLYLELRSERHPLGLGPGFHRVVFSAAGLSRLIRPGQARTTPLANPEGLEIEVSFFVPGAGARVRRQPPRHRYYPEVKLYRLNPESPLAVGARSVYAAGVDIWQVDAQWRSTRMSPLAFTFAGLRFVWTVRRLTPGGAGEGVLIHREVSTNRSELSFQWPAAGLFEVACQVTVTHEGVSGAPVSDRVRESVVELQVKLTWLLATLEAQEALPGGQRIWSRTAAEQTRRAREELAAELAREHPDQARVNALTSAIDEMRGHLFPAAEARIGPIPIHAVFLEKVTSKVQPLNLFLAFDLPHAAGDPYACSLIDVTYPPFYATYPGTGSSPITALIDAFESSRTSFHRTYPPGHILARVTVEDLRGHGLTDLPGFVPIDYLTETDSVEKQAFEWLMVVGQVAGAIALAASFLFPPALPIAGGIGKALLVVGAIGATLSIANIATRVREGRFAWDVETFSDIANIAAFLAGIGGAAVRAVTGRLLSALGNAEAASAEELAALARAGIAWQKAFLITGLGVDVANGVLVTYEVYTALQDLAVEDDGQLLHDFQQQFGREEGERRWREQRYLRILDLLVRAGLGATMVAVSMRSSLHGLGEVGRQQAELEGLLARRRTAVPPPEGQIGEWRRVAQGSPRAEDGLDRLLRRGHDDVVANMLVRERDSVVRGQLEQISALSDRQVDGLAAIKRVEADLGGDIGGQWSEVLDLSAGFRDPMLDLVADIEGSVDGGLDLAIKRGLTGGGHDIQGTLGHLFAARTLRGRFPGARFQFELSAPSREIDIQMNLGGRTVDVEVKTNLGQGPTVDDDQILKDLGRHIGDEWADMLYLYAPQQAGNLAAVERGMLRNLARLHAAGRLPAGMTLAQAEGILRARFTAARPWRLVDVFAY